MAGRVRKRNAPPPAHDGVYVIGGLGARGLTFAPLLGELIAAEMCGEPPLFSDRCATRCIRPGFCMGRSNDVNSAFGLIAWPMTAQLLRFELRGLGSVTRIWKRRQMRSRCARASICRLPTWRRQTSIVVGLANDPSRRPLYDAAWLRLNDTRVLRGLAKRAGMNLPTVTGADVAVFLIR